MCNSAEMLNLAWQLPMNLFLLSSLIYGTHGLADILNIPKCFSSRTPAAKADAQDAASTEQPLQKPHGQSAG